MDLGSSGADPEARRKRVRCCCGTGVVVAFISIILFAFSWDTLEPTEYGLVRNDFTSAVDLENVYEGGRYFVWLRHSFLRFPRHLVTLSYGDRELDDLPPIRARTGPGESDDPGGQPIELSISFQYQIDPSNVADIYRTFAQNYDQSFLRFAQQSITNVAQEYTPSQFWTMRREIEKDFRREVDKKLFAQGFVHVPSLQLRKISFESDYENNIIRIQLQSQLLTTKTYQLDVTRVLNEVEIMDSETKAEIAMINAEAEREAAVIINEADAEALKLEQRAKAEMYMKLKEHMGWDSAQFLEYVKMSALNSQPSTSVTVGVNPVGQVA